MRCLAPRPLAAILVLAAAAARAQTPPSSPRPTFVPGLYETESRNAAFEADDMRSRQCLAAPDYDAFRRETVTRYRALPQFEAVCRLSDTRAIADGFAFAMDCTGAETIVAFHFAKDLVRSSTRTRIAARPDYSSTILTLSRRIGACPGRRPPPGQEL